jgi:hypothetical protein
MAFLKVTDEKSRNRTLISSQRYGSEDPDPNRNVTGLEHCIFHRERRNKEENIRDAYNKSW